jgi:hypothetical protein
VLTIFINISQNNLRFKIKSTQSTTACPSVAAGTDRFRQGRVGPTIEARSIRRRINVIRRENRLSRREWQVVGERLGFGWLLVGFGWEKRKALNGPKSIAALTDAEQLEPSKDRGG